MSGGRGNALVVVNPASAGGRTLTRWPRVDDALRSSAVDFQPHMTTAPGEATEVVRAALRTGCSLVIVVGGDGTLNEVVNGFFDDTGAAINADAELALVPSGTGGDFRKSVAIPKSVAGCAEVIARGARSQIDVGRVDFADGTRRFFINIADCGIGGEVVARVNRSRYKSGGARGTAVFLGQSLAALLSFGGRAVRVTVDGEVMERHAQSVVVANGRCFGGGMRIAPHAEIDDGHFDVIVVAEMGRMRSITSLPALYRGRHLGRRGVEQRRGRVVHIEALAEPLLFDIEGEQVGSTPAMLTCVPKALWLCVEGPISASRTR